MPRHAALLAFVLLGAAGASVGAGRVEIVDEEHAADAWQRANRVPPPAWPERDAGVDRACVNLAFLIDRKGATGSPILLRSWAPGMPQDATGNAALAAFAQSAAASLAGWRYQPAAANRKLRPVITNAVFLFARDAQAPLPALREQCQVGDLRDFLYRQSEAGYRRGNLNKGLIDRRREEFPPTIPQGCDRHEGWCE